MTETGIMTIGEKAEAAIIEGDLSRLTPAERVTYYNRVCDALGLLATTKPFGYMVLSGKLTLYAMKGCTDQLRKIHGVSLTINSITIEDGICVVSVSATDAAGRSDVDIGAVVCGHLKGEDLANAKMRAVTKAKRRVTLSLCGWDSWTSPRWHLFPKRGWCGKLYQHHCRYQNHRHQGRCCLCHSHRTRTTW